MKKFTLLFIAFIFSISFINAQSYALSWEGETLGDTVVIRVDSIGVEAVFHAILTNNSNDTDSILIRRRFVDVLDSITTMICWGGICFSGNADSIFITLNAAVLKPGQASDKFDFTGHYTTKKYVGTSIIEYTFFNKNDENESITVVVKYVYEPDGIIDKIMANGFISELYPNPATNVLNFDYELTPQVNSANIRIINLLGSVVKNVEIDKNATHFRMDISDLTNGIYFYSVIINNEVYKTKKLIVR